MSISSISNISCDWPKGEESTETYSILKSGIPISYPEGWMNLDLYYNSVKDDPLGVKAPEDGITWTGVLCPGHSKFIQGLSDGIEQSDEVGRAS